MSLWRLITAPFRRGPRKPLASRQPELRNQDVPLGMEATDLNAINTVNRRNQSLERTSRFGGFGKYADDPVRPLKDDETYAKEYHRLYGKEK